MPEPPIVHSEYHESRLVEPVVPPPRAILFGAGHVARALGPMVAQLGFQVVVCDDGDTGALATLEGAPWLHRTVHSFDIRDIEAELGALGMGDHVFIITRDHAIDQDILERVIGNTGLTYLGMIGSRRKISRFHQRLSAKGLITDEQWSRLRAPIGLDLGAETPAEIAVAVAAQLVEERRRGRS